MYVLPCARRRISSKVSRKTRNRGDNNNDPEFPAFKSGSNTSIHNCPTNFIVDGSLLISRSGDCGVSIPHL